MFALDIGYKKALLGGLGAFSITSRILRPALI